ncbi:hypothetical protein MKX03_011766 [Papaver bracteatum]|nr:hypothetical protein MKX03_011766 [Papaver bracteatum]
MELSTILFTAFIISLFLVSKATKKNKGLKLPPGPWELPLIGNLHQLSGREPHHALTELSKKYGPLMHLQTGEASTVVVSSPAMAKQIMKVHDLNFSDRGESLVVEIMTYNYKDMEFAPYGDYWRKMRKIFVVQLLSTNRVQSFRSLREEVVSNVIENISLKAESHTNINIGELVYSSMNDIVAKAVFGKTCKHKVAFISLFHDVTRIASGFTVADLFPSLKFFPDITGWRHKLEMLHKEIDGIMSSILDDHRQKQAIIVSPGITGNHQYEEDFVDTLLRLQADGGLEFPFTDDNIKAIMFVSTCHLVVQYRIIQQCL